MMEFVQRHASSVIGTPSGFDRLLFRGTLRRLANAAGLSSFLSYTGVLPKDFGAHSMKLTEQVDPHRVAGGGQGPHRRAGHGRMIFARATRFGVTEYKE